MVRGVIPGRRGARVLVLGLTPEDMAHLTAGDFVMVPLEVGGQRCEEMVVTSAPTNEAICADWGLTPDSCEMTTG